MSDIPENIQRFNLIALQLFAKLYEAFPTGIDIKPLKLGDEALPKDSSAVTQQQAWDFGQGAYDVVFWLAEEGFLRFENPNHTRKFYNARLTMKGLAILTYVPTSLQPNEPKEPLIEKVKRVLATGAEKTAAEGIRSILCSIFTLALAPKNVAGSFIIV